MTRPKVQEGRSPDRPQTRNATGSLAVAPTHPHRERVRQLLKAHPELRPLVGHSRVTAAWILAFLLLHTGLALLLPGQPWWIVLAAAYTIGAVLSLGLWTLLHECSHDLVFRRTRANVWLAIVAGLPHILPSATTFRKYHLLHHTHLGHSILDADVPGIVEARWVGRCRLRKAAWLFSFCLVQSLRVRRMKEVRFVDAWFGANLAVQILFNLAVFSVGGWTALFYLLLANVFSLGLHPLGGRWIQEHFPLEPGQETYSYYGPMNRILFNAGYHNEHHDLVRVPWMRLPRVKAIAPEYYEPLYSHRSWTRLVLKFLLDPDLNLTSRAPRAKARARGEGQ